MVTKAIEKGHAMADTLLSKLGRTLFRAFGFLELQQQARGMGQEVAPEANAASFLSLALKWGLVSRFSSTAQVTTARDSAHYLGDGCFDSHGMYPGHRRVTPL